MTYKVANISDTGTATKHGADDLDKIAKLLNGTTSDAVTINTSWKFDQTGGTLIKKISEPSTPASGYATLYMDTVDNRIKIKKSDGTVVILD